MSELSLSDKLCRKTAELDRLVGNSEERLDLPNKGVPAEQLRKWMKECRPRLHATDVTFGIGVSAAVPSRWWENGILPKHYALAITEWARNEGLPLLPWEKKGRPETEWRENTKQLLREQLTKALSD